MATPLRIAPCRTLCRWGPTRGRVDGQTLFACTGCGSQWVPSEPWTPRQADGSWPPGVREALARTGTGGPLRDAPAADAAGTAGS